MALDHVRPLKIEAISEGGNQDDFGPTETDASEDYIDAKGVSLEGLDDTYLDRDPVTGQMRFVDPVNGIHLMAEFLGGTPVSGPDVDIDMGSFLIPNNAYIDCGSF